MKKQSIVNLVKYHMERNESSFIAEVADIARDFDKNGDYQLAEYLMELISNANVYTPQSSYTNLRFLEKKNYSSNPLLLPDSIKEDVLSVARTIQNGSEMSKFLFYGAPGSGKTESAYQIARLLDRDIFFVRLEELVDSRMGETSKNVVRLFDEIKHLNYIRSLIIFDELDALALNRIGSNDLREMGRVTSTFLREMDSLSSNFCIIATTNLIDRFDKALIRRFDATISFDRYTKKDLIDIADELLTLYIKKSTNSRQDLRLFNKILDKLDYVPYPGDMKQIIRTSIAFSDNTNKYDYLRKLYITLHDNPDSIDIQALQKEGYTTREIEILTRIPKSSVSRMLKENLSNE